MTELLDVTELLVAVDQRFVTTGAGAPGWPDPHPGSASPAEEEYSRCLDPAKYLILRARLEAWRDVLLARGTMTEEPLAPPPPAEGRPPVDRAVLWRPTAPGALPLVIGFRSFDAVPDNLVELGVGAAPVWVATLPTCGCDACDDGSARYLEQLDGHLLDVLAGTFVHVVTASGATLTTTSGGWNGHGGPGGYEWGEQLLAEARAGTSPHRVLRGEPWV